MVRVAASVLDAHINNAISGDCATVDCNLDPPARATLVALGVDLAYKLERGGLDLDITTAVRTVVSVALLPKLVGSVKGATGRNIFMRQEFIEARIFKTTEPYYVSLENEP